MRYPKATKKELTAPRAKFRVIGVDVGTEALHLIGDFNSLVEAEGVAKQNAGTGRPVFVYNDQAKLIVRYGSWH